MKCGQHLQRCCILSSLVISQRFGPELNLRVPRQVWKIKFAILRNKIRASVGDALAISAILIAKMELPVIVLYNTVTSIWTVFSSHKSFFFYKLRIFCDKNKRKSHLIRAESGWFTIGRSSPRSCGRRHPQIANIHSSLRGWCCSHTLPLHPDSLYSHPSS